MSGTLAKSLGVQARATDRMSTLGTLAKTLGVQALETAQNRAHRMCTQELTR